MSCGLATGVGIFTYEINPMRTPMRIDVGPTIIKVCIGADHAVCTGNSIRYILKLVRAQSYEDY